MERSEFKRIVINGKDYFLSEKEMRGAYKLFSKLEKKLDTYIEFWNLKWDPESHIISAAKVSAVVLMEDLYEIDDSPLRIKFKGAGKCPLSVFKRFKGLEGVILL